METLGYIALIAGLVLAARFVSNTRENYSACCGRGCRGCKTYEARRNENKRNENKNEGH